MTLSEGSTERDVAPGRRELNKREKLRRIRASARAAFLEKGYDDATLRDIAKSADVAFGTLFLYAKDKEDLLLLLFEEQQADLIERGRLAADGARGLDDTLGAFFTPFFEFFAATPDLSRHMLRELTFSEGIVAERIAVGRNEILAYLSSFLAQAQAVGELGEHADPNRAARVIFGMAQLEIRACVENDESDVAASLEELKRQLQLFLAGLGPR